MSTKKVKFNKQSINKLPVDKPVLYQIKTKGGKTNYVGISKRGEVQNRISDHLGNIPGASVKIEQFNSIANAREEEANVIKKTQPKYNKQGK